MNGMIAILFTSILFDGTKSLIWNRSFEIKRENVKQHSLRHYLNNNLTFIHIAMNQRMWYDVRMNTKHDAKQVDDIRICKLSERE